MEKRQHRRIPFRRTVHLVNHRGDEQVLESSDFSLSGMAMVSQRPAQVGEKVRLRFRVNTLGESRELNLQAEIRHVDPAANNFRLGVSFLN
ncbi:PilZ domain-containing protein [Thiohalophilus thiocyanatoxydans]|uniref:PilZ domain-containing protein n=1 Tax=Thiohalophilus thiocyanatoxydans TaxID=381308 RepID=A0A4V3H3K3_9GAMM|nr:PilZ domain-containing protein [Thiohalophilus thiocyanatoxydans]TDX99614.1 PilZ domain-containing protein [Thiohalophilus thiocyanatoxydans]